MDKESKKEFDKLNSKINLLSEDVNLGTVDNSILALMILIAGVIVSILITGITSSLQNPIYLLIMLIAALFSIPFIYLFLGYLNSIYLEDSRFTNKIYVISILISLFEFVLLIIGLPYLLSQFIPKLNQGNPIVFIILTIMVYGIPIMSFLYLRKKVTKYFLLNFPNKLLNRLEKMSDVQRSNALKKLGTSLSELKKLANN